MSKSLNIKIPFEIVSDTPIKLDEKEIINIFESIEVFSDNLNRLNTVKVQLLLKNIKNKNLTFPDSYFDSEKQLELVDFITNMIDDSIPEIDADILLTRLFESILFITEIKYNDEKVMNLSFSVKEQQEILNFIINKREYIITLLN